MPLNMLQAMEAAMAEELVVALGAKTGKEIAEIEETVHIGMSQSVQATIRAAMRSCCAKKLIAPEIRTRATVAAAARVQRLALEGRPAESPAAKPKTKP